MKNITVSVDDQTYRRARIIAAERSTSVSALVKQFLANLARGGDQGSAAEAGRALLREDLEVRAADRLSPRRLSAREIGLHLSTPTSWCRLRAAPQAERGKRERSLELLDREGVALSVQVLQEFYVQATRTTRADRLPHDTAAGLVVAWTRFRVQAIDLRILAAALEITKAYGYSY